MDYYMCNDLCNIIHDYNGKELRLKIMDILDISEEKLQKIMYDNIIGYNTTYNIDILILCHIGNRYYTENKCCRRVQRFYYDVYKNNQESVLCTNRYYNNASFNLQYNKMKNIMIICCVKGTNKYGYYKNKQKINDWDVLYKNEVKMDPKNICTKSGKYLYITGLFEHIVEDMMRFHLPLHNIILRKK